MGELELVEGLAQGLGAVKRHAVAPAAYLDRAVPDGDHLGVAIVHHQTPSRRTAEPVREAQPVVGGSLERPASPPHLPVRELRRHRLGECDGGLSRGGRPTVDADHRLSTRRLGAEQNDQEPRPQAPHRRAAPLEGSGSGSGCRGYPLSTSPDVLSTGTALRSSSSTAFAALGNDRIRAEPHAGSEWHWPSLGWTRELARVYSFWNVDSRPIESVCHQCRRGLLPNKRRSV